MSRIALFLVCWSLAGCVAGKKTLAKPAHLSKISEDPRIHLNQMELSYSDLQMVMDKVQWTVDGHQEACDVSADAKISLSQSLKRMLDERYEQDMNNFMKSKPVEQMQIISVDCKKLRSCGVFYSFLDYLQMQAPSLTPKVKRHIQSKLDHRVDMEPGSFGALWVCQSQIFKELQNL